MAYVIFFAGLFLGTIFGFVLMGLLAVAGRASDPERHQRMGVISPGATVSGASVALRWRTGHRRAGPGLPMRTRASS
jgi:hypothetical protein